MCTLLNDDHRARLGAAVAAASGLVLYLDYDGTLAPIVADPDLARLPARTLSVLEDLSTCEGVLVAVMSGRSLADVKTRVGLPGLVYSGNHGLQIEGESLRFEHPEAARRREALEGLNHQLIGLPLLFPGVEVEAKGLTTTVHYRQASDPAGDQLGIILRSMIPADHPEFLVTEGKRSFEIRPRIDWNKGTAVRWIHEHLQAKDILAFVLGDDRTDEDAFAALADAITIHVGPADSTTARYCLSDQGEVGELLDWLLGLWKDRRCTEDPVRQTSHRRPGLVLKAASPIPTVRLRRSVMTRRHEPLERRDASA
jgi:trehalose-phosphatase